MKPLQLAVLAGVLGLITQAQATININSLDTGGALSGVNYANFDNLTLGNGVGTSGGITVSFTPDAQAVLGGASGLYAEPYLSGNNGVYFGNPFSSIPGPDSTIYLTTGSDGGANPNANVTMVLPSAENYFGLLWGSVDSYNTLSFYDGNTLVGQLTGSQVIANANGNQQFGGTTYVNITSDSAFNKVIATSSQYAFEFDNVAYGVVPEPTTLISGALLLLPFGASMVRVLRRNQTA
jgi:hypothetical protein